MPETIAELEKQLAALKRQRERFEEAPPKQETTTERARRIADFYGIDLKGWKISKYCGTPYLSMSVDLKTNTIYLCEAWMKDETDEIVAFYLAHEISHKRTRDEALATFYGIEMLKGKMPPDDLKGLAGEWYDNHMSRPPGERALDADYENLEKVRKYITGEEEIKKEYKEATKQKAPVKQKVLPKKKGEVSFDEMLDAVNRYQEGHGEKVAQIDDNDMRINFFAPKEAIEKMNNKMSKKEITDFLMSIPWGHNWALGMARAVYGPKRWDVLPKHEQEIIMKDLIRRKLTPALIPMLRV